MARPILTTQPVIQTGIFATHPQAPERLFVVLAGHKPQPTSNIQAVQCVRCPAIINVGDPGQAKKDSAKKKAQVKGVGDNYG